MNMKRLRNKVAPFEYLPFSKKQVKVLTWWTKYSPYKDYTCIIADGAIRSGKTVSLALSYVMWGMECFDNHHFAICGRTVHACRRNVIAPLKSMLRARGYQTYEVLNENLLVIGITMMIDGKKVSKVNYFHVFGGSNEASQSLIQGMTLAGVFFDEVALMPESFVSQATARCSVEKSKFWFSCNPDHPFHWFHENWIKEIEKKRALYLHFTMDDNPSLSEEKKAQYKTLFDGIFYKRFILGLWVLADGVVYPMFDDEKHCIDYERPWTRVFIAGDFGVQNPTTFGLYGYYAPEKHYHLIGRYYHHGKKSGQMTTRQYVDVLVDWIKKMNYKPAYITLDPSALALAVEMKKDPYLTRRKIPIIAANNHVQLGIQFTSFLLSTNKLTFYKTAEFDKQEFASFIWNEKRLEKGDEIVVKANDHCMDTNRYAVLTDATKYRTYDKEMKVYSGRGALDG